MVVLPEPDSPTMPSDSPGITCSDTPSTALTGALALPKCSCRSRTFRIGSAAVGIGARWRRMSAVRPSLVTEPISICVYGSCGAWKMVSTGPVSTTLPWFITITWSAISATTPMSCVMNITAMPWLSCSFLIRSRISAWVVTSSAVVGSSAINSAGLQASDIAIITRWRMPPENSKV